MRVIANQGETVDAICWRVYGCTTGMVEQVLLDNPGLADLGPDLPQGTPLEMPDISNTPASNELLQLWE